MSSVPDNGLDPAAGANIGDAPSTSTDGRPSLEREAAAPVRVVGPLKLRARNDDLPQKWWFASTAIPLIAATVGPLSNVLSIAALVTPWRVTLANNGQLPEGTDDSGIGIADPQWEIACNAVSLACGFAGNFFLLLNFTGRVRYIVALPLSIVFWIFSSALLISITSAMNVHVPPVGPAEIYSQGFWHAVLAAVMYVIGAAILAINLTGYLLGHFPQQFVLETTERTLILQTMGFFFWLAGGAGIFCAIEGFTFTNALYYADVSVLTIGFGDFYPKTDAGRGFLFLFELLGIVQLGLVISSVSRFVSNISTDKIIKTHEKHAREATIGRTVTSEHELRERLGLPPPRHSSEGQQQQPQPQGGPTSGPLTAEAGEDGPAPRRQLSVSQYGRLEIVGRTVTFHEARPTVSAGGHGAARKLMHPMMGRTALSRDEQMWQGRNQNGRRYQRRQKLLLLQEEKDRFEAMREIQDETRRFKQCSAMALSLLAFVVLWCFGALVFMFTEDRLLGMSYFQTLYFCFVSLFTIGYGDYAPKSNIGKPFFIVWSVFAVPTMTVWIQEMSATVIAVVNDWTMTIADFTVLPKKGVFKVIIGKNRGLKQWIAGRVQRKAEEKRPMEGFQIQSPDDIALARARSACSGGMVGEQDVVPNADPENENEPRKPGSSIPPRQVNGDQEHADHDLARQLSQAIKNVAQDLRADPPTRYSFAEWMQFTRLIRFSQWDVGQKPDTIGDEVAEQEEKEGLVQWDWLGEDSPMLADTTEAQWLLDRLCESLNRYTARQANLAWRGIRSDQGNQSMG